MRIAGVVYEIDWKSFKHSHSFFIPCLDCTEAKTEIQRITNRLGFDTVMKAVIENNIRGVRVWRV